MASYNPRAPASAFSTPASTTLFRRLTWEGTVPLEIRVESGAGTSVAANAASASAAEDVEG